MEEAAIWHWQVAQNLAVETRYRSLTAYGVAGELLARHRLQPLSEMPPQARPLPEPPARRAITAPEPRFPARALPDLAVVEVLVDEAGTPHQPLILEGHAPAQLYAALEALRRWRFEESAAPRRQEVRILLAPLRSLDEIRALDLRSRKGPAADRERWWRSGRALLSKALAEAARGEDEEAIASWKSAQHVAPALALAEPGAFGEVAAFLALHRQAPANHWRLRSARRFAADTAARPPAEVPAGPLRIGGEVTAPVKIYGPLPGPRLLGTQQRFEGTVTLRATIDRDGLLKDVNILGSVPGLSEDFAPAFCRWRFRPATLHGSPVEVFYELKYGFTSESFPPTFWWQYL